MLSGREQEQARLAAVLGAARRGAPAALVLVGEAGCGKTALLRETADAASGLTVLRAAPAADEAGLPLAGLTALLRPFGAPADAEAALALLDAAAAQGPVLAVVDDAHFLDAESVALLAALAEDARLAVLAAEQASGRGLAAA